MDLSRSDKNRSPSSTSPSIQYISSTQKDQSFSALGIPQFHTENTSVQNTPQFHTQNPSAQHIPQLHKKPGCWTGVVMCGTDVWNWGVLDKNLKLQISDCPSPIFHDAITPTKGNKIQQDFTLQKMFHIEFEVLLTRSNSVKDSSLLHFGQDDKGIEGNHRVIGTTEKKD